MPIPPFDQVEDILPPHTGNPALPSDMSPYPCRVSEVVDRFFTSPERKVILVGFLELRELLLSHGLTGMQWLDGSFVENIEARDNRPPRDIDVLTFVDASVDILPLVERLNTESPAILNSGEAKRLFHVDHFLLSLSTTEPAKLINLVRYWFGLFSHRRDGRWKGMLQVPLVDREENRAILDYLRRLA